MSCVSSASDKGKEVESRELPCADSRGISGLVFLIIATIALIFAFILAGNVFDSTKAGQIAGGLVVGSMASFGIGSYLLLTRAQ